MIKYFCDVCGTEMNERNTPHRGPTGSRVYGKKIVTSDFNPTWSWEFEVTTGMNGVWNTGNFCIPCILEAINKSIQ